MKKLFLSLLVSICLMASPVFGAAITDKSIGGLIVVLEGGATTEILVGGGASTVPVWTTCTGSGAPVRAVAPTLTGELTLGGTITSDLTTATAETTFYFRGALTGTSGTHNTLRARAMNQAVGASTTDIRGVFGQATTTAAKYGGTGTGVFGNFIAKNTSTTVTGRGGFFEAETEATPTALTNLYGVYIRTKVHLDPATDYYGLMIDNELMATGFTADAYIGMKSTTWAAGNPATYGIDMNGIYDLATADIRGHHGEIIYNNPDGSWSFGSAGLLTSGAVGSADTEIADLYLAASGVIYGENDQGNTLTSSATGWTANLNLAATTYGSDGSISDAELLTIDDGATTEIAVGGGAGSSMVWTTATGSGAPVRATSPTVTGLTASLGATLDLNEQDVGYEFGTIDDDTWSGDVITGTAGENVTIGDICYLKSDGKFWMADANVEAEIDGFIVMSTGTINAEASGVFLIKGLLRNDDEFEYTVGEELWVPEADGLPTATQPADSGDFVKLIGWCAADKDYIWFDPDRSYGKVE